MKDIKFKCNLCHCEIKPNIDDTKPVSGYSVYWNPGNEVPDLFADLNRAEHHICYDCALGVHENFDK